MKTAGTTHRSILAGVSVLVAALLAVALTRQLVVQQVRAQYRLEQLMLATALRTQLGRELDSVKAMSSALRSYLAATRPAVREDEMLRLMADLHASTPHVRNLGVAVDTTLRWVYPKPGNEAAIDTRYPDIDWQWPKIREAIESGRPILAGPVRLIQGGKGLIYREPVYSDGRYWGLLSTVIDDSALLDTVFTALLIPPGRVAIRGTDARGAQGDTFFGDASLFTQPDSVVIDMEVPGGSWQLALSTEQPELGHIERMTAVGIALALILALGTLLIVRQRDQLQHMALYDTLTGLPKRVVLQDRMRLLAAQSERSLDRCFAVIFIDLDRFKDVNDRYGHRCGDATLVEMARRLSTALRRSDTVGRWGGDELVVITGLIELRHVGELVNRLREAVQRPVEIDGHMLTVGASVGVAIHDEDGSDLDTLVSIADARMYHDKRDRQPKEP